MLEAFAQAEATDFARHLVRQYYTELRITELFGRTEQDFSP